MSKRSELYGQLAEIFTELQALEENGDAKSGNTPADGVAGGAARPKGPKAAAPAPVAAAPAPKPGKAKAPAAPAITFEVLKAKLTEVVNTKGKDAVKEILSGFGAPRLGDLGEDNWAEAYAQGVALLAEEEPDATTDDDDFFGD